MTTEAEEEKRSLWDERTRQLYEDRRRLVRREFSGETLSATEYRLLRFIEKQIDWYEAKLEEPMRIEHQNRMRELRALERKLTRVNKALERKRASR